MRAVCLSLLLCASSALQLPYAARSSARAGTPMMAGAKALAKKTAVLETVRQSMSESALMFCVRSEGLKVNEINMLRQSLPEGVTLKCVKNNLINIAAKDFEQFNADDIESLLHYSNYWFFASEDKMRDSFKAWETFTKDTGKKVRKATGQKRGCPLFPCLPGQPPHPHTSYHCDL
eukprot:scaffold262917_cov30-Tisochrysis_lutea.AAC.1